MSEEAYITGETYMIAGILILVFGTVIFSFVMFLLHRWKRKI